MQMVEKSMKPREQLIWENKKSTVNIGSGTPVKPKLLTVFEAVCGRGKGRNAGGLPCYLVADG